MTCPSRFELDDQITMTPPLGTSTAEVLDMPKPKS